MKNKGLKRLAILFSLIAAYPTNAANTEPNSDPLIFQPINHQLLQKELEAEIKFSTYVKNLPLAQRQKIIRMELELEARH